MNTFTDRAAEIAQGDSAQLRGILLDRASSIEAADHSDDALLIVFAHVQGAGHDHSIEFASHDTAPDVLSNDTSARELREKLFQGVTEVADTFDRSTVGIDAMAFASHVTMGVRTVGVMYGDGSWIVMTLSRREDYLGHIRSLLTHAVSSEEIAGLETGTVISPENPLSQVQSFVISRLDGTLREVNEFVTEPV